jgi:hypothetical protein
VNIAAEVRLRQVVRVDQSSPDDGLMHRFTKVSLVRHRRMYEYNEQRCVSITTCYNQFPLHPIRMRPLDYLSMPLRCLLLSSHAALALSFRLNSRPCTIC